MAEEALGRYRLRLPACALPQAERPWAGSDAPAPKRRKLSDRALNRILLVDDDADIQAVAALALIGLGGYTVEVCSSAREALQRAPSFGPDLIVLDVMMPGRDGVDALKGLRQIDALRQTPVLFLTANLELAQSAHYKELDVLGVIAKPFDPSELPSAIETLWGQHQRRKTEAHAGEFEALRQTYAEDLAEKIRAMQTAAITLANAGWDRPTVESIYMLAHRMAGSSGLYRMKALSRAASALEGIVKRLLSDAPWPPATSPVELVILVKAVGQTARKEARLARQEADPTDR
ncbi:MAG TPA: response regulator [Vicinamibacteria bacterium]|jgi:CheY-like chemotaxis protein